MDAYAVERSPSSNEMLRLVAGLQSALTLEEVERAYLSNVVGVLDADGHGLYRLDPQTLAPVAQPRRLPVWDVLTPREQEIAELVSAGLTTKEIASRAFVSENTVKQHLKRIFAKTDVRNRAELMQRVWAATGRDGVRSGDASTVAERRNEP